MTNKKEPFSDYLANDAISSSDLKNFMQAPAKFKAGRDGLLDKTTPAMAFGSAFHDVVLCNGENTYFAQDIDLRTKIGKEKYELLRKKYDNVVRGSDVETLKALDNSIRTHSKDFMGYVENSEPETSWYATCPVTGLKLKARPDVINRAKKAKLDLKTTVDANKAINQVYKYKYYLQAAFHTYVLDLCGVDVAIDGWFFIEKEPPYLQRLVLIPSEVQKEIHQELMRGLNALKEALDNPESFSPRLERQDFMYMPDVGY